MKKIDVYVNGRYLWSTNRYNRCKDAVNYAETVYKDVNIRKTIRKIGRVVKNDKVGFKAHFSKF